MKVALGIGNYALGRYRLVVTQAYHCSVFHMPKYPIATVQLLTFIDLGVYVVVNFLSQVIFVFLLFLGMVLYANEFGTEV